MNKTLVSFLLAGLAPVAIANLTVVTTTEDLASIVRAVGGDKVAVSAIVTGARDPHTIDAKPGYMSRLMKADLFVAVGLDLEVAWEDAIIRGSRNTNIRKGAKGHLYASDGIFALEKPSGRVTRAEGDIHPFGNPHIWLDPANARKIAAAIANKMAEMDPANMAVYQGNASTFQRQIDVAMFGQALVSEVGATKLWSWSNAGSLSNELKSARTSSKLSGWAGRLEQYRGQNIVAYHRSWSYLANRFGFVVIDELEPKPGIPPTAGHLAKVIRNANASNVLAIVQESFYSKKAAETVASRTKAKVAVVPLSVGNESGITDYFKLMDTIVSRIATAMGG